MTAYDTDRPSFTPWDDRALPAILTGEAATNRATCFSWFERQFAQLCRRLAETSSEPAIAETLRRQADLHTWHAEVWEQHLGGASGVGDTPPPGCEHLPGIFDLVAGGKDLLEQVGGISRVLIPRAVGAMTYIRTARGGELTPADDRWMGILLADAYTGKVGLELYVQAMLETPADAERLASFTAQLESPLVKAGGLFGPDTLGGVSATAQGVTK